MKCTCPKCRAHVELDLPEVTEEGTKVACTECKARFTVKQESFGGRALRKAGEITCARCGEHLGPQTYCRGCGVLFPSYLVGRLGGKKTRVKTVRLETAPFPQREHAKAEVPRMDAAARPVGSKSQTAMPGHWQKHTRLLVVLGLLIAVAAGGAAYYQHYKKGKEFTTNFILAIYASTVGEKKALETCNRIAAEWKEKGEQNPAPRPNADEVRRLDATKAEVDRLMKKVEEGAPPKELKDSVQKLSALSAAFRQTHALANSPAGTLASFTAAAAKQESAYQSAARDLRKGLPPKAVEKMRNASRRYKGLQEFLAL